MPTPKNTRRNLDIAVLTLNAYKLGVGCVDCGYRVHPSALQFDHRDPRTKHSVDGWVEDRSKLTTHSRLRRYLAHVDECCDVRCANCHSVRTITEKHWLSCAEVERMAQVPSLF